MQCVLHACGYGFPVSTQPFTHWQERASSRWSEYRDWLRRNALGFEAVRKRAFGFDSCIVVCIFFFVYCPVTRLTQTQQMPRAKRPRIATRVHNKRKDVVDVDTTFRVLAVDIGTLHIAHSCVDIRVFADGRDPSIASVRSWELGCIFPEGPVAAKGSSNRTKKVLTLLLRKYLKTTFGGWPKGEVDVVLVEMQDYVNRTMECLSFVAQAMLGELLQPHYEDVVPAMQKVHFVRARAPALVPPIKYGDSGISKKQAYDWRKKGLVEFVKVNLGMVPPVESQEHDLCDAVLIALSYKHYARALAATRDAVARALSSVEGPLSHVHAEAMMSVRRAEDIDAEYTSESIGTFDET